MANTFEKIIDAASRAITGKARPTNPHQAAMAAIAQDCGKNFIAPDELVFLRGQQKIHEAGAKVLLAHDDVTATAAWREQAITLEDQIRTGAGIDEALSRQQFIEQFEQKREAAKEVMRKASQACLPIAETAAGRFAAAAKKNADEIEAGERERCEKYAVPFEPSPVVVRIRQCSDLAVNWVKQAKASGYTNSSPRALLPYCEI
jgi:hypothetical protein